MRRTAPERAAVQWLTTYGAVRVPQADRCVQSKGIGASTEHIDWHRQVGAEACVRGPFGCKERRCELEQAAPVERRPDPRWQRRRRQGDARNNVERLGVRRGWPYSWRCSVASEACQAILAILAIETAASTARVRHGGARGICNLIVLLRESERAGVVCSQVSCGSKQQQRWQTLLLLCCVVSDSRLRLHGDGASGFACEEHVLLLLRPYLQDTHYQTSFGIHCKH